MTQVNTLLFVLPGPVRGEFRVAQERAFVATAAFQAMIPALSRGWQPAFVMLSSEA